MEDQDLVRYVLNGNRGAFEMLIDKYQNLVAHMVSRVVNRPEDHEEICQDVFLRVYDRLEDFNFKSKLSTWIATIAYRMSINFIQKKELNRVEDGSDEGLLLKLREESTPYQELLKSDLTQYINRMVAKLPMHYRTVITLFHLEEMSYPEIVEVTNMPEGTVKNYLFRARKILKDHLDEKMLKDLN